MFNLSNDKSVNSLWSSIGARMSRSWSLDCTSCYVTSMKPVDSGQIFRTDGSVRIQSVIPHWNVVHVLCAWIRVTSVSIDVTNHRVEHVFVVKILPTCAEYTVAETSINCRFSYTARWLNYLVDALLDQLPACDAVPGPRPETQLGYHNVECRWWMTLVDVATGWPHHR